MQNQRCPKCGGVLVFIVAADNTLCLPQCENGSHLDDEEAEEATKLANIEWAVDNDNFAHDWCNEFMRWAWQPRSLDKRR